MQYRAEAQKVQVTTVVDINSVSGPKVDIVEHLSKMATDRPMVDAKTIFCWLSGCFLSL
jgi:hypothetical protein